MRADRALTLRFFRPLHRLRGRVSRPSGCDRRLPILMYHSVSDDHETGDSPYYRTATSPPVFARQMAFLASHGYRGVTLAEGLVWLKAPHAACRTPQSASPVVLTFDDGFGDFQTAAWPILQRHGFRATMFLPTAFIGDTRHTFGPAGGCRSSSAGRLRDCLTWDEVRELHRAGIEFGSHTVSHPKLVELPWPQVELEIRTSKIEIESRLGAPVTSFAYPYAYPQADRSFTHLFGALLTDSGYTAGLTTRIGRVSPGDDPRCLKRLPINDCDDEAFFQAKLQGDYDWLGRVQVCLKTLKQLFRAGGSKPGRTAHLCPKQDHLPA